MRPTQSVPVGMMLDEISRSAFLSGKTPACAARHVQGLKTTRFTEDGT